MKKRFFLVASLCLSASIASADPITILGSGTLDGITQDAIRLLQLQNEIEYIGEGSGAGETALVEGTQGIAPMSRRMKAATQQEIEAAGRGPVRHHVIALDAVALFVKENNATQKISIPTLKEIFECRITRWEQIPGSAQTGAIVAYRRDDVSGTTDTFKTLVGIKKFGDCVQVADPYEIREFTSTNIQAIAFAGESSKSVANRGLAVSSSENSPAVLPKEETARDGSYPLSREVYVVEVPGNAKSSAEADLLKFFTGASPALDTLIRKWNFFVPAR